MEDEAEEIWSSSVNTEKRLSRDEKTKDRNHLTGAVLKLEVESVQ